MRELSRTIRLLCGVLALGLLGCGETHRSNGAPGGPSARVGALPAGKTSAADATREAKASDGTLAPGIIASVGRHLITEQMLDRWIAVEAEIQYAPRPSQPVPRGVVPVAPAYRDCIAYLARKAGEHGATSIPSRAVFARQCAQQRELLLKQTLEILIGFYWVKDEAARAAVELTRQEVRKDLRTRFPTEAEFRRYLSFTRVHASEERLILENTALETKWQHALLPVYGRLRRSKPPETMQMADEVDKELGELAERMKKREIPRTRCRAGYVLTPCREYVG